ncbi:CAMP-specific 3',5'-cyclic phosphodiesterase [Plakobranchus ocellatus]|uniref:3',5'-cyclic-AMP phosphodiesterase n=1 Tax=Plakobranchus ocellatus TaxID=259542 RepID=A0AAV4AUB9_9GAST|nr:CAMP-specific 3',5'-cyclic phosphodiesterase [Plakobranchus ocellatus]
MQKLNFLSPLFHKNGKKGESGKSGGRKSSTDNRKASTDKPEKGPSSYFNPSSSSSTLSSSSSKRKTFTMFTSSRHAEDLIVTPFAQILASLRSVRSNYVNLTNVPASRER